MTDATKKCPFCAETIQAAAVVCRHCGRDLVARPAAIAPKKRSSPLAYIFVTLLILGGIYWFFSIPTRRATAPSFSPTTTYTVTYKMSGTARRASLTYQNAQGGTEQKEVSLPWSTTLNGRSGQFVYISGQNSGESGTITCEILLNSTVVKTSTSEGAYKIASCSGKI